MDFQCDYCCSYALKKVPYRELRVSYQCQPVLSTIRLHEVISHCHVGGISYMYKLLSG